MTLLEMLVVLALMSIIASLLSQALTQVSRIERTLSGAQLDAVALSVKAAWLRQAVESMLPAAADSVNAFAGDEHGLSGLSVDPPTAPASGLARLKLTLQYDTRNDVTELRVSSAGAGSVDRFTATAAAAVDTVVLTWPGQRGRFLYLDARGAWQSTWPQPVKDAPLLPRGVAIETGIEDLPRIDASILASPVAQLRRDQVAESE